MEFASEEMAEKNYTQLKENKLRGKQLFVDYVGEKSSHVKKSDEKKASAPDAQKRERDPKKLHLSGFDKPTKEAELKKLIATTGAALAEFTMPTKSDKKNPAQTVNMGFAFALFASEADAKKALDALNGKQLNGKSVKADYAFQRVPAPATNKQQQKQEQVVCGGGAKH